MTSKQISALRSIVERYGGTYDSTDFPTSGGLQGLPDGYVSGWVKNGLGENRIYIGCSDMLEEMGWDSVVPAICANKGCDYTTGMEPDQDRGWCEECRTNSVQSCLILAGVI